MEYLFVIAAIIIGLILLRIVGKILKFVIGVAIVVLIGYVVMNQLDNALSIPVLI
ncbi:MULTISPECIES: hypothetical protein [Bacillaceae]|uniref:Uncharacterized protein n=1 Tax=Evansella alkalicola TaxID=745819 RepID=A0ABS6JNC2_9BACI|nr:MULTISPECIES: hypothetical protein [Bacillaceae]MBU9720053.1 hypothetical protein [Bacillus alkalicola]